MAKRIVEVLLVLCTIGFIAVVVLLPGYEGFDQVRPISKGDAHRLYTEPLVPREEVDIMIAEDGKLYLFYIDTELVNVYTVDGHFLYGFQFPDRQNGVSDMAVVDGLLYVDNRTSGIFVFQEAELIRFEDQHRDNPGHDELEKMFTGIEDHEDGGYTYSYLAESNKILRRADGEYETVVEFPQRLFEPTSLGWIMLLLIAGYHYRWPNEPNKRTLR